MSSALTIKNINKSFGKRRVLHDVSFETYTGEVFGFLGPNGAGKTTLIKLIVGLLNLEEGSISVCGYDIHKDFETAMSNIGGIVENPELYKYMTGMQNLRQYANMRKGVTDERIREVIELVGLSNRINDKVGKYSLGMRQRLGLAQSLLHKPKVLVLDEPTNGLDPAGIEEMRGLIKTLPSKYGMTVMISSHILSEIDQMATVIGIINQGSLIFQERMSVLDEQRKPQIILKTSDDDTAYRFLAKLNPQRTLNGLQLGALTDEQTGAVVRELCSNNLSVYRVEEHRESLEDIFLTLTGKELTL